MPVTISIPVLQRRVRLDLRRHRANAGLSVREAADRSGVSSGNISHYESGRNKPSDEAATNLLTAYGVADELPEFLAILAEARRRTPSAAAAADPEKFNLYAGLEQGAAVIESWNALVLHGLVQTAAHAEVLLRAHGQGLAEAEIRRRLRARVRRQDVLSGDNPAKLWLVIKHSVLTEPVGDPEVQIQQLTHLLELSERPHVEIQVVPRDVVAIPALHGAFTTLQFPLPNDPGLVYVETRVRGLMYEEPGEIQDYAQVMSHLKVLAADQEDSRRIVEAVRKEIK
jgi:transcriptional regulator with XRE-family HTH domain